MAECGALIKLLVVLCMSFNCLMRPVTSAVGECNTHVLVNIMLELYMSFLGLCD